MRTKTGTIVSDKMEKTITVEVVSYKTHPKYKKQYQISKKFYAHDPEEKHNMGETVTIYETRPLSKTKCWTVVPPTLTQ